MDWLMTTKLFLPWTWISDKFSIHWSMFARAASETSNPVEHVEEWEDACMFTKDPEPQHSTFEFEQELFIINVPPLNEATDPFTMQPWTLIIDFGFWLQTAWLFVMNKRQPSSSTRPPPLAKVNEFSHSWMTHWTMVIWLKEPSAHTPCIDFDEWTRQLDREHVPDDIASTQVPNEECICESRAVMRDFGP